ncbi:MAG: DUF4010 domain-containing protein [archaeon]
MALEFLTNSIGLIGRYVLVPLWFGLLLFVLLEILSRKKGVSLSQEFHTRSFAVSTAIIFGWLVYFLLPSNLYLPMETLTVKFVVGLFMVILTFQYTVFLIAELFSMQKTIISLGIGAGLIRSTIAASVVSKMCAEDEGANYDGAAAIMISKATLAIRNFVIIMVVGIWLNIFAVPPMFFTVPMLILFISCLVTGIVFYKKGSGGEVDFQPVSLKSSFIFLVLFLVMYYFALGVIGYAGIIGLYALSGAAGFLYGGAHLFIIASLLFTQQVTAEAALVAALAVTMGSMFADLPYTFFAGARGLTKLTLIASIIPLALAIISLLYFI